MKAEGTVLPPELEPGAQVPRSDHRVAYAKIQMVWLDYISIPQPLKL